MNCCIFFCILKTQVMHAAISITLIKNGKRPRSGWKHRIDWRWKILAGILVIFWHMIASPYYFLQLEKTRHGRFSVSMYLNWNVNFSYQRKKLKKICKHYRAISQTRTLIEITCTFVKTCSLVPFLSLVCRLCYAVIWNFPSMVFLCLKELLFPFCKWFCILTLIEMTCTFANPCPVLIICTSGRHLNTSYVLCCHLNLSVFGISLLKKYYYSRFVLSFVYRKNELKYRYTTLWKKPLVQLGTKDTVLNVEKG